MNDLLENTPHELTVTDSKRDLSIIIFSYAKRHAHVNKIASKANGLLGWMKSAFVCRDVVLLRKLNGTYIRLHLEFAAAVWNLHYKTDIDRRP